MTDVAKIACPDCGCEPCECLSEPAMVALRRDGVRDLASVWPAPTLLDPDIRRALIPGLTHGSPVLRETLRVDYYVKHVPSVVLKPCVCGAEFTTPDQDILAAARSKQTLPPIECSCGRILIGEKKLVEVVQ